jgi:hypothetical protein
MNFLKRFLLRSTFKKQTAFHFQRTIITGPNIYTKEVGILIKNLTESEKICLYLICDLMEEGIDIHRSYMLKSDFSLEKFLENEMYPFYSYFELTCIYWVVVTNFLKENNVRDEVGQLFYRLIEISFDTIYGYKFFKVSPFKSFENAIKSRQKIYVVLLNRFFKPRMNEISVYKNLFQIIIEMPLCEVNFDTDFFGGQGSLSDVIFYNKIFTHQINNFSNKLKEIDFTRIY